MTALHGKPLESEDPFELIGMRYPIGPGTHADHRFTTCIVEEFALAGFTASEVARLFESEAYVAPHAVLLRRGAGFVREIIERVFGGRR
jgi:hypothetical protein